MSTHNLCFGPKIRKLGIPQFYYIKVGYKRVYILKRCLPDEIKIKQFNFYPLLQSQYESRVLKRDLFQYSWGF